MLKVDGDGTLKNGSSTLKFANLGLPLGILKPGSHVLLLHTQGILEALAHAVLVVFKLLGVCNPNFGWAMFIKLVLDRFSDQLFTGHLDFGRCIVFYAGYFHQALFFDAAGGICQLIHLFLLVSESL